MHIGDVITSKALKPVKNSLPGFMCASVLLILKTRATTKIKRPLTRNGAPQREPGSVLRDPERGSRSIMLGEKSDVVKKADVLHRR